MSIQLTDTTPTDRAGEILTPDAMAFVQRLHERFAARRDALLRVREERRITAATVGRLDFLDETRDVREADWQVAEAPPALRDRRVEMTGPATPAKMAINALNSGAKVWLADLEDASCPTWSNVVDALLNLRDAARGTLSFTAEDSRQYRLRQDIPLAVVVTRPRGWHLPEKHVLVDGLPAVGALVDFGLHFFHLAQLLLDKGQGPYYYLPKIESHLEARLWNDVFDFAEQELGIPAGTIRATVLIETIPAAFEMEEILYELRDHASGLNAGRWDYLFSIIKFFRDAGPSFVLADRADVAMSAPFMRAYTELLVTTCHRRGAFAMGGMAAFIPSRKDEAVNEAAFAKVTADKSREAGNGFDGSWVAHPDLVPVCQRVFDQVLGDRANQLDARREYVDVLPVDLLDVNSAQGQNTEAGLRNNLNVAVAYIAVWLSGNGAVTIHNLMEDAATAEISRSQVWQQIRNNVYLADTGETVTRDLVSRVLNEEVHGLRESVPADQFDRYYRPAAELVRQLCLEEDFANFLTLPAYELVPLMAEARDVLSPGFLDALDRRLAQTDAELATSYPGEDERRQPIHTVYVPADTYTRSLPEDWGRAAQALVDRHGGTEALCATLGLPPGLSAEVAPRVEAKLADCPIEDLRIDFEDGYGDRGDAEDREAVSAATEVCTAFLAGELPSSFGIRFKCFEAETRRRGLRTLDLFLGSVLAELENLPAGLVLTFPKVSTVSQVEAMVSVCEELEQAHNLPSGALRFEIQVETPPLIVGSDGRITIAAAVHAGAGRVTSLHYGTFDYSASLQIAAAHQASDHPAADFAKQVMQVAVAGTGVHLSDGSTNIIPVGSPEQVEQAWTIHAGLVRRALERGYYQGWDMHPGHLPTRFATTFAFFRQGYPQAARRLSDYSHKVEGEIMDEPATARALARFLHRGLCCGALDDIEVRDSTGLTPAALASLARPKSDTQHLINHG